MNLTPQWALLAGLGLSFVINSDRIKGSAKVWSTRLLQLSVVLLGASLNFHHVIEQGAGGALLTLASITAVFVMGFLGIKLLRLERTQGLLITMGTAICGGSAIGALAPVLRASPVMITVSIGMVFFLNALAVFCFPSIGEHFALTQEQFGVWSAIAIHDTSAVVATASIYGERALEVATTIKLTRALWIIPIVLMFGIFTQQKNRLALPWFILGFLLCSLLFTFVGELHVYRETLQSVSKLGFSLTLFLLGLTFHRDQLKEMGARPFVFAVTLWLIVSAGSLLYVRSL